MIYPIVAYGDPVLRKEARDIVQGEIDVKKLAADMFETMYAASGVGLAAPQIGMDIRFFVVDGTPINEGAETEEDIDPSLIDFKKVFINAEILEEDGDEWAYEEGCLSIPGVRADVYRPEFVTIRYFDTDWVEDFKAIESVITDALTDLNISIEHVGSTAVPKLAAKPIIDIDIVYGKDVPFEILKKKLEKIGYYHNGNQGIENREVFKRQNWWSKHPILDAITHHLYACPVDSEELRRHILFRNYLIIDETARIEYQQLKYEIAAAANQDKKQYAALKEVEARAFVNDILAKADQL